MAFVPLKSVGWLVIAWCLMVGPLSANVRAAVFNSGFELDDAGYSCVKYLQPDTNPAMVYEGIQIDASQRVGGHRSLRIPNRFAEQVQIHSKDFLLVPGKSYTCSLWLKSQPAGHGMTVFVRSIHNGDWKVHSQTFRMDSRWQKHQFTFQAASDAQTTAYHLLLRTGYEQDSPAGDVWVDDIQILPTGQASHEPAPDWEIALAAAEKLKILSDSHSSMDIRLDAWNPTDQAMDRPLNVMVIDDYDQTVSWTRPVRMVLQPHERQTLTFTVPVSRYGAYRIEARGDSVSPQRMMPGYFAVIGKYQAQRLDYDRDFCVGLNVSLWHRYAGTTWYVRKTAFKAMQWTPQEYFRLLSQMGCRLARDWGSTPTPFSWYVVQPQKQRFDWSSADEMMALCRQYDMAVMPVLGGWDFISSDQPDRRPGWPAWLKPLCRVQDPQHPASPGDRNTTRILLPPMDLWRQYVRAVAERYQGEISYYEIANEPNLYLYPPEYLAYLASAFREIKSVSPKAKVVGFCATGDHSGDVLQFMNACFQAKGLEYADIVSFHPYSAPDIGSANPADKQIQAIQSLISGHGDQPSAKPLWNTECFYLHDYDYRKPYEEEACPPHENARRFLTDLGEGVGQSLSVTDSILWKNTLNPLSNRFGSGESFTQSLPSATYVVYNALARFFEAAKPRGKWRWGHETVCYFYEKNGLMMAAFWRYADDKKRTVKTEGLPSSVRLYDLFGNEQPIDRQMLPIDRAPRYLVWPASDHPQVLQALKQASVESESPVLISTIRPVPVRGGWVGAMGIQSGNNQKIDINAGIQGSGIVGQSMVSLTALPEVETIAEIPIRIDPSAGQAVTAKIMAHGRLHTIAGNILPTASVCWLTSEMGSPQKLLKHTKGTSAGHQAQFQARYDRKHLYLRVTVRDATPSGDPSGRQPWQQDAIELFVDPFPARMPLKHPERYHAGMVRFFIVPYASANEQWLVWPSEGPKEKFQAVSLQVRILPQGYEADLAIPLDALGIDLSSPSATAIGFDMAVDDASNDGVSQLFWHSSGDAYKNRLGFGYLCFDKE